MAGGLATVISRAAAHTNVPVAVGFGISTPEQAAAAADAGADGVIVGSRLVRAAGEAADPAAAVRELVGELLGSAVWDRRSVSICDPMGLILTATAGLCIWIVIWALNVSGLDAIMIAIVMVLIAIGVRNLLPYLPGRRD